MENRKYIQVILPLRLEWEPFYAIPEGMEVRIGDRVSVEFARRQYVGMVSAVDIVPKTKSQILEITEKVEDLPAVFPEEIQLWRAVADYYLCSVGEVYKAAYPGRKVDLEEVAARSRERMLARLEKLQGQLEKARKDETRERYRRAIADLELRIQGKTLRSSPGEVSLSPAQEKAVDAILGAFHAKKTALLDGVTGSGKTEIYMKLARETILQGRNVLYLVPEIALSRQLEDRVAVVFPDVQVYHSAETEARRRNVADIVRKENGYLVLGTRSSLFLPHHNLGLIIVDEEHDSSYKQDSPAPRYHARETAIMLGLIQGSNVLLGSATPSLESIYNAENGKFVRVDLKERFHLGEEARIQIVDTVAERRKRGMVGNLSRKLLYEIKQTLDAGEQAVLLRSRRAYAPALQCIECGTIPKCPHCNVSFSLHRSPDRFVCHYCGHTETYTGKCSLCGGTLQPLGAGTQRIEEELQEVFPSARIARLDSDETAHEAETIRNFAHGKTDILIGTQIVTKGFDFDRLSLVAVIQADNILAQHDFRADERAYQLLEQFRGRSGRRGQPARFLIQTREPEHHVFQRLINGTDNSSVLLQERREFHYPPYARLIHLVLRDHREKRLDFMARELRRAIPEAGLVIGPFAPVVDRIADQYIRQIRIMLPRDKNLIRSKQALAAAVSAFEKDRKYTRHIVIDVDPA